MNLKYYLRGLGIGIIVTAVIMGAASGEKKETLSDAQIKARAAELGMVEQSGVLAELEEETAAEDAKTAAGQDTAEEVKAAETPKETKEPDAEATPIETKEPEAEATPKETNEPEAAATPEAAKEPKSTATPEELEEPKATAVPKSGETVIIEIKSGEGSYAVCQKLEEAGLIASASSFDTYLYQKGYDKKLQVGTYEIPAEAEPEAIAEILAFGS